MNILGYDPYVTEAEDVELVDLPQLLAKSDIVSLHVPHNEDTHHLIDEDALSQMKQGAILVNTCRGGVVDQKALCVLVSWDLAFGGSSFTSYKTPL
jgi:phosphoglycerate dehydrogenase-like enzyme